MFTLRWTHLQVLFTLARPSCRFFKLKSKHFHWCCFLKTGHYYGSYWPRRLWGPSPEVEFAMRSLPLLLPTFSLSFFLSLFCLLLLTHFGETPKAENLFPQYFGITRRYMRKKIFLSYNLNFLRKKADFWAVFLLFTASIWSRPPGPPKTKPFMFIWSHP